MNDNTVIRICKTHGETEWYSYDFIRGTTQVCKECRKAQRRARYKDPEHKKNDTAYTVAWFKRNPELRKKYDETERLKGIQTKKDMSLKFFNENKDLIQSCMEELHPRKHKDMDLHSFYDKSIGKHALTKANLKGYKARIASLLRAKFYYNISVCLKHKHKCIKDYSTRSEEFKQNLRDEATELTFAKRDLAIAKLFKN
jgi:hypothetical protein